MAWPSCFREDEFNEANTCIEEAKSYAINDPYHLARAMETQAKIWYGQGRLEDAKLEVSRTLEVFEKLGAAEEGERCRNLLCRWNE